MNEMASSELAALQNRLLNAERKGRLRARFGSVALAAALLVVAAPKAVSQGIKPRPAPTVTSLQAELETLRTELLAERTARIAADTNETTARTSAINAEATARTNAINAEATARANADTNINGTLTALNTTVSGFGTRITSVEGKTAFMKVIDGDTVFTNTNLVLDPTQGKANLLIGIGNNVNQNSVTGTGNLVIRTNQGSSNDSTLVTGSGNLVVGEGNQVTSFGSLVVGFENRSFSPYGVALGSNNTVGTASSSTFAPFSIAFGTSNTSFGFGSVVSGGRDNVATGEASVVSGGQGLTANGQFEWLSPIN